MKRFFLSLAFASLAVFAFAQVDFQKYDLEALLKKAKKESKLVLLLFEPIDCHYCNKSGVGADYSIYLENMDAYCNANFVTTEIKEDIDSDLFRTLKEKYQMGMIENVPGIVILDENGAANTVAASFWSTTYTLLTLWRESYKKAGKTFKDLPKLEAWAKNTNVETAIKEINTLLEDMSNNDKAFDMYYYLAKGESVFVSKEAAELAFKLASQEYLCPGAYHQVAKNRKAFEKAIGIEAYRTESKGLAALYCWHNFDKAKYPEDNMIVALLKSAKAEYRKFIDDETEIATGAFGFMFGYIAEMRVSDELPANLVVEYLELLLRAAETKEEKGNAYNSIVQMLGYCDVSNKKEIYEMAIKWGEKAIDMGAENHGLYRALLVMYETLGNTESAAECQKKVTEYEEKGE